MNELCNIKDLSIERGSGVHNNAPVLYDCDGNRLFTFYLDGWTDDRVKEALAFANYAYRLGKEAGILQKVNELKKVFGL